MLGSRGRTPAEKVIGIAVSIEIFRGGEGIEAVRGIGMLEERAGRLVMVRFLKGFSKVTLG